MANFGDTFLKSMPDAMVKAAWDSKQLYKLSNTSVARDVTFSNLLQDITMILLQ
jgi:hypothetical protein